MHGAQRWLELDRDALVPMTPTTSASATWPAPLPIEGAEVPIAHEPASHQKSRELEAALKRSATLTRKACGQLSRRWPRRQQSDAKRAAPAANCLRKTRGGQ